MDEEDSIEGRLSKRKQQVQQPKQLPPPQRARPQPQQRNTDIDEMKAQIAKLQAEVDQEKKISQQYDTQQEQVQQMQEPTKQKPKQGFSIGNTVIGAVKKVRSPRQEKPEAMVYEKRPEFIEKKEFNEIKKATNGKEARGTEFGLNSPTRMEFKYGSRAILYKEDMPVRIVPFVWQQDKETKRSWAIFSMQQFHGKKVSFWQFSYPLLTISLNRGSHMVENYREGCLAAYDINTLLQVPARYVLPEEMHEKMAMDNLYRAQDMQVWRDLLKNIKKKFNWTLIIILILVAVVAIIVVWYLSKHPHALQNFGTAILGH